MKWFWQSDAQAQNLVFGSDNILQIKNLAKALIKEEGRLRRLRKHMIRYSEQRIQDLIERHMPEKKEKFNKEMHKLVEQFRDDMKGYMATYKETFESLAKMIVLVQQLELGDLKGLQALFEEIQRSNKRFIFPTKNVKDYLEEYRVFENDIRRMLEKDEVDNRRIPAGKHPVIGFFKRHFRSDKGLARSMRHLDNKVKKDTKKLKGIEQRLMTELQSGIEQDFLSLFLIYLKEEGRLEAFLEAINDDAKELVIRHINEWNEVAVVTYRFSQLINQYQEFSDEALRKQAHEFYSMKAISITEDFVNKEVQDEKSIYNLLLSEESLSREFEHRLAQGQQALNAPPTR